MVFRFLAGCSSSSEMVRSIGELELERGSEPAPAPFEGWEKKLEIIGCLSLAPVFCVELDSGCRIAAIGGFTVTVTFHE